MRVGEPHNVRLDAGAYDPVLGTSYAQLAVEGLSHQLSQGAGGSRIPPGHRYSYYKLLETKLTGASATVATESGFFDGIDTTLPGLADRLGGEASKIPFLKQDLLEIERTVKTAVAAFTPLETSRTATPLLQGLSLVNQLITKIAASKLSPSAKSDLLVRLQTKRAQFERAANLALGVALEVLVDPERAGADEETASLPSMQQTLQVATPGQSFTVTARFTCGTAQPVRVDKIDLQVPKSWTVATVKSSLKSLSKDDSAEVQFRVTVPENAHYTRPYWHRDDPQTDSILTIDSEEHVTLPLPPPPIQAAALYSTVGEEGRILAEAKTKYVDPMYGQMFRSLAVAPALSVELQPSTQVAPSGRQTATDVIVGVRSNVRGPAKGSLRVEVPSSWRVTPAEQTISFAREGEFNSYNFKVTTGDLVEGRYEIRAVANLNGKKYNEGYSVVTRKDLDTFYHYRPARQRVSAVEVKLPSQLKVGYIMGAGDEIPAILKQLGMDVEIISAQDLASGDLSRFQTIVTGIRAYDVRSDIRDHNRRLLDFVAQGGTLVVQYNQGAAQFNSGRYTPYPATAGSERVSVEEAPVEILVPEDPIFGYPNRITARDFDGWVQERGIYFMNKWSDEFRPLLSSHDPGESPLKGGLLRAKHGKGTYIFTGYVFFRQLPSGVGGAARLFVNLISAGHEPR